MERTTFATNFWVSPSKARKKTGKAPINLTITLNGQRVEIPVEIEPFVLFQSEPLVRKPRK